jgi:hypothetical protein
MQPGKQPYIGRTYVLASSSIPVPLRTRLSPIRRSVALYSTQTVVQTIIPDRAAGRAGSALSVVSIDLYAAVAPVTLVCCCFECKE